MVLTVDPARRLADALGLAEGEGADLPHRIELAGSPDGGALWAVMLDAQATFDRLVREQSPDERQAEAVLDNAVYKALSGSLAGAEEYMAVERLHQLHTSGEWDLVIVDTPPSRHAIDLLEAPDRLTRFLGHPIYRALTAGQRTFARVTDAASSIFLWVVKRLAGPQLVQDVLEFFRSLAHVEPGLRKRADEVSALLRAESTSFVVVTSPRSEAVGEANHLIDALEHRGFPFGGVIANMVHPMPESFDALDAGERQALESLDPGPLADHVAWHRVLTEVATSERDQLASIGTAGAGVPIVELPLLDIDIHDLDGLSVLADLLT